MEPCMVCTKDGLLYPVITFRDMLDIIDDYAGSESREYVSRYARELEEENEARTDELVEYRKDLEEVQDDHRRLLTDIREEADGLMELLEAGSLDLKALKESAGVIWRMVNDVL